MDFATSDELILFLDPIVISAIHTNARFFAALKVDNE